MLNDEQRNEVIVALADALVEISQACPDAHFAELVKRVQSPMAGTAGGSMYLADLAVEFAGAARQMKSLAARVLSEHPEVIAQARMISHFRRSAP